MIVVIKLDGASPKYQEQVFEESILRRLLKIRLEVFSCKDIVEILAAQVLVARP